MTPRPPAVLALAATLAACGHAATAPGTRRAATTPPPVAPSRAARPCHYPDDRAGLDRLRAGAQAVVVMTLASRRGEAEEGRPFVRWRAHVERVLSSGAAVPDDVTIVESTRSTDAFFHDTRYVAFLFARHGDEFSVFGGVEGLLPIRDGRVYAECYGPGTTRTPGTGERSGETVEAFVTRY